MNNSTLLMPEGNAVLIQLKAPFKKTGNIVLRSLRFRNLAGMLATALAVLAISFSSQIATAQNAVVVYSSSGSFVVPAGVTSLTVECWGAGGGGGGTIANSSDQAGGGGGGGAFSQKTYAVTPGNTYTITVGAGGTAGLVTGTAGGTGGVSSVSGPGIAISANGGAGGGGAAIAGAAGTAGAGAAVGAGYDVVFAGGNGTAGLRTASNEVGGAGGGGAGNNGAGGNATATVAAANTVGGAGGAGTPNAAPYTGGAGAGAATTTGSVPGVAGNSPGGGAAGSASYTTAEPGAIGGTGQVVLIYLAPACTTPGTASGLTLTPSPGKVVGTFSAPGSTATNYLVIRTTSPTPPSTPVNGTTYTPGTNGLGGYIVSTNAATGFTDVSIAASTLYYYWIYSYNTVNCTGGPLYSTSSLNGSTTSSACTSGTNTLTIAANTSANLVWSTAAWSAGHAPYSCEDVVINWTGNSGATAYTSSVSLDVPVYINSLTINESATGGAGNKILFVDAQSLAMVVSGNVTISCINGGSGTKEALLVTEAGGSVTIGGTLTVGASGNTGYSAIGNGGVGTAGTFNINGNVSIGTLGLVNYGTLTNAVFDGTGAQTFTNNGTVAGTALISFKNITVGNVNSPVVTLAGAPTTANNLAVNGGNLTINPNATLVIPSGYTLNQATAGSGVFTLNNGSTLRINGTTGGFTGNNFPTSFGSYGIGATSTVLYGGTATQTVVGGAYGNLSIANAAGVTVGAVSSVANVLTLTSGVVTTTTLLTLTINNPSASAVTGGSTTAFIKGPLNRALAAGLSSDPGVYNFPVGAGTTYLPYSISSVNTGATAPVLQVTAFATGTGGTPDGSTVSSISTSEYWQTNVVSGNYSGASLSLTRQTAVSPLNVIAKGLSTSSPATPYSSLGGTPSGNSVNNSGQTGAIAAGTSQFNVFARSSFNIVSSAGANGSISPLGTTNVTSGNNQSYTITPVACYHVADVLVDGVSVGAVTSYAFTNVTAVHTISASFAINTYSATITPGANGTITPGSATVNCGSNNAYTIAANACYHITDVTLNGVSQGAVSTLNVNNVTANYTVAASFDINTYTITATSGANGSVTPAGASTVNCGSNNTYTISPNACYSIADVLVDGVSVGAVGTYSFTNVTANHTISASFVVNGPFTITATSGANGSVTPAGSSTVNCGTNNTYAITPDACYSIADVLVDGVSVGAVGTYTFTNTTANHTISATFTLNTNTITATSGANGSVTPAGASTVNCGSNITYTISPNACYSIADVLVDGVSVGAVGTYTFTNVTANHTISASFVVNGPFTITATSGANGSVTPAGASTVNCGTNNTYTITPDACYSIADVLVDGVSVGAVGTYTFTNTTANHTISATFTLNTYTITATSGSNGSVTPAGATTVNCGTNNTYTITPDACYSIADVLVDGVSVGAVGTYTFTNTTANHTISATFTLNTYTITATSGSNGSVTPAGSTTVNCGTNNTYTITADACYSIADVLVDGVSVGAVGTYTFTNVTANHTISATFSVNTYTITATSGSNGSVTPAGASTVNCGTNNTYTITPDACYSIADVLVDGVSVGAAGTYTFTNTTANHTISATFTLNTYTITATSGSNGSVTPAGATTVNCGDNSTYTITANACYAIADVLVDGVSVGAVGTYTFTNVTANHTISASFVVTTYTINASAGTGGTIAPSGAATVNCGANATYNIAANVCYSITDVVVDGISQGAVTTYTFTNVTANHTISASFTLNTYTIAVSSGANGTVTPGTGTVNCGSNATYTITPATCYHVTDVLVDGSSAGAVTSYTFTNVTANHTISASFAINAPLSTPVVTGIQNVCPYINNGQQLTYTATSAGATGFTWITPPNVTIISGQGTGTLTVTFQAGFNTQPNKQLRVTATSSCGNSSQAIFYLTAQAPVTPSPITASGTDVCAIINTAGTITYKIPQVSGATYYVWTAPSGTNISHPSGTGINDTLVTLSFVTGFNSSAITVRAANDSCGASGLRSLTITKNTASQPGLISGPTNACPYMLPNGTAATYSISAVAGSTSYTWTVPAGATIITGQGSTSITMTYPSSFTSGVITVSSVNGCGTGPARSLSISKLLPGSPAI